MSQLIIHPGAEADLKCAIAHFEEVQSELGERFHDAIGSTFARILEFPESNPEIAPGVRRALDTKFRYKVIYTLHEGEVHVVAVIHGSRNPDAWTRRLFE